VDVESDELADDVQHRQITAGIRLNLYRRYSEAEYDSDPTFLLQLLILRYGDRVRAIVKLRGPKNFRNLGALDYVSYLHRQGFRQTRFD
jgi:predicted membrane metal-binding protein